MDRSTTSHGNNIPSDNAIIQEELESSMAAEDCVQTSRLAEKADAIRKACDLQDLDALVSYATSEGGFLQDDLRRLACKSISGFFFFFGGRAHSNK